VRASTVLGSAALALAAMGMSLTCAPRAQASTTYFVSPSGQDSGPGSQSRPWKSISRVNQARLSPGDTVLFQTGQVWHQTLQPRISGSAASPITYGSYGGGRAVIDGSGAGDTAVSLSSSASYLAFRDLEIRNFKGGGNAIFVAGGSHLRFTNINAHDNTNGFWDSSQGRGSTDVQISGSLFSGLPSGIQLYIGNVGSTGWRISTSEIANSGDSCIIDVSANTVYDGLKVHHCGYDTGIHTFKHGIYARGQDITIRNSQIYDIDEDGYGGQCISQREGGLIENNQLHDCLGGIGWFDYTRAAKQTLTIRRNQIWDYRNWGIYLDTVYTNGENAYNVAGHKVIFLLSNNTVVSTRGPADGIDIAGAANGYRMRVDIENTVVVGTLQWALSALDRGRSGRFTARNNVYWNTGGQTSFKSQGTVSTNRTVSGDQRSLIADPRLVNEGAASDAATYALQRGSPAVDFGVTDPRSGSLSATCTGGILSYCGSAPDAGAQESR
jgi:hypothetical protein